MSHLKESFTGKFFLVLPLAMCITALLGCNGTSTGDILDTVPAAGVLTYQGKPLEYYQVIFMKDGSRPAAGVTDVNGQFKLGTNEPDDGAPPGDYNVAVIYVGPPSDNPEEGMMEFSQPPPPKEKLDAKFADADKSGIAITIPKGGSGDLKVEL